MRKRGLLLLKDERPDLAEEWDIEKNGPILLNTISLFSNKKVWWKCKNGHSWETQVSTRAKGSNCPFCSNKKVSPGENDLATLKPEIAAQWNKRNLLLPSQVSIGSSKKVWWKCEKGHEWQATVNNRVLQHQGCPYCANKRVWIGDNDLSTTHSKLLTEWDYNLNTITPREVTAGSRKRIFWKCKEGHSWVASVNNRTNLGQGCPYCARLIAIPGKTDIASEYPELMMQWDFEKNGLDPSNLLPGSHKKVWWRCNICGNVWICTPHDRTSAHSGCPKCYKREQTSFPEQAIYFYVKKAFPNTKNGYTNKLFGKMELDIFIPETKVAIEYDGIAWHSGSNALDRERKKYQLCKDNKIQLIRIRESKQYIDNIADYMLLSSYVEDGINGLENVIRELSYILHFEIDIDLERDRQIILKNYYSILKENSLASLFPNICKEWNYQRNKGLSPNMYRIGTKEKVWWKCSKGHEWLASIDNRVRGNGCPYCSGRKAILGTSDLKTVNSQLADRGLAVFRQRGQAHAGKHPEHQHKAEQYAQKSLCFHIHTSL